MELNYMAFICRAHYLSIRVINASLKGNSPKAQLNLELLILLLFNTLNDRPY
jgi:hypothetical protein